MQFVGFCSYPHGGYTVLGLLLSGAAAMTATLYSVSSCRFLVVTFRSETGDFEEFFNNAQEAEAGRPSAMYKAGIGLFQWLRPYDDKWSDGACAGYQESMLDEISNGMFETSRFFGVLAIISAFIVVVWGLMMFCVEFNRIQIVLFCIVSFLGTFCAGMTFSISRSSFCEDLFLASECEIDEGGLVMIAGVLLWLATLVLSAVFMRPSGFLDNESVDNSLSKDELGKLEAELERQRRRRARREAREREKYDLSTTPETAKSYSNDSPITDDDRERDSRRRRKTPTSSSNQDASQTESLRILKELRESKSKGSLLDSEEKSDRSRSKSPHERRSKSPHERSRMNKSSSNTKSGRPLSPTSDLPSSTIATRPSSASPPRVKPLVTKRGTHGKHKTPSERKIHSVVTVDDVSNVDSMEVYISKRLDRIQEMAEV